MVLYIMRYDIPSEKATAYREWVGPAIQQQLAAPGLVSLQGFRWLASSNQVMAIYEFASVEDWAAWREHDDVQKVLDEGVALTENFSVELWGPSPVLPEPARP
jgi:hypothetical protein